MEIRKWSLVRKDKNLEWIFQKRVWINGIKRWALKSDQEDECIPEIIHKIWPRRTFVQKKYLSEEFGYKIRMEIQSLNKITVCKK